MRAQAGQGPHPLAALGALAALLALAGPARAASAPGVAPGEEGSRIVLLPVQDRAGEPAAAAAAEDELRARLSERHALPAAGLVRDTLRRLRIRDTGSIPPALLKRLAEDLGGRVFFAATLHRAAGQDAPEVALSGRLMEADRPTLAWAGFAAASGLEGVRWLGLGRVVDRDVLVRQAARRLARDFEGPAAGADAGRPRRAGPAVEGAFHLDTAPIDELGTIAVIPFDVVADAPGAGAMMTDLALAALVRRGATVALPGAIEEVLRQRGALSRGEIDALTRAAVRAAGRADAFFTGTVEECSVEAGGAQADPRLAVSARLLEAGSGRILWTAGLERRGRDHPGAFGRHRLYAIGSLAEAMMASLVDSLAAPEGGSNRRQP